MQVTKGRGVELLLILDLGTRCCEEKAPVTERWVQIFSKMEAERIKYDALLKATKWCYTTYIERVFSVINNVWSDEKSRLSVSLLVYVDGGVNISIGYDVSWHAHQEQTFAEKGWWQRFMSGIVVTDPFCKH
jgi:hypothetical protein